MADSSNLAALRGVLASLIDGGGKVLDTAAIYGASEEVAGEVSRELGITEEIFWASYSTLDALAVAVSGGGDGSLLKTHRRLVDEPLDQLARGNRCTVDGDRFAPP